MENVELYSKQVKCQVDEILRQTDLVNVLSEFGEVIIGGSYKYDLMWGPDIDVVIKCQDPRKASVEALEKLIKLRLFQKYEYGDFVNFKRAGRPESYIMNLILPFEGEKWEIETWFFEELPDKQKETDELIKSKLNKENKIKILEMKKERDKSDLDKHNISSVDIYKGVLINNIKSIKELI